VQLQVALDLRRQLTLRLRRSEHTKQTHEKGS
jgi:hypothetical protein